MGICRQRTYEGQAAMELEMVADPEAQGLYAPKIHQTAAGLVLDTPAMFRGAVSDRLAGVAAAAIAGRFHKSLARGLTDMCLLLREKTGLNLVALSGGVLQNALLVSSLKTRLEQVGFEVLTHSLVPPNDGGISLGQAAVAAAGLGKKKNKNSGGGSSILSLLPHKT